MAERKSRGEYTSPALEREHEEAYALHAARHPQSRGVRGGEMVVSDALLRELQREAATLFFSGDRLPSGDRVIGCEQAERFAGVFERAARQLREAAEAGPPELAA